MEYKVANGEQMCLYGTFALFSSFLENVLCKNLLSCLHKHTLRGMYATSLGFAELKPTNLLPHASAYNLQPPTHHQAHTRAYTQRSVMSSKPGPFVTHFSRSCPLLLFPTRILTLQPSKRAIFRLTILDALNKH